MKTGIGRSVFDILASYLTKARKLTEIQNQNDEWNLPNNASTHVPNRSPIEYFSSSDISECYPDSVLHYHDHSNVWKWRKVVWRERRKARKRGNEEKEKEMEKKKDKKIRKMMKRAE